MSVRSVDVRSMVSSLKNELIDLAIDLVRTPSVTGDEDEAQRLLAERLTGYGLEVDLFRIEPAIRSHPAFCDDGNDVERLNLVARWGDASNNDQAALALNGHIDVVPPGEPERWESPPFEGDIRDDHLFGRGACDMKGGLVASVVAIVACMKLGLEPKRPVLLQSVVGEETGGLGTLAAITRGYRADAAIIAEPTSLELCPVQAGALSFRITVPGLAAHGAMRQTGVSAVEKFWTVYRHLEALERERHHGFRHPMFASDRLAAPLSLGVVHAGSWPSTVPEELVAEGRYGVFPGEDVEAARDAFEMAIREASMDDDWLREHPPELEWIEGQFEPGETSLDAPLLSDLVSCHEEILATTPPTHGVSYGSDLRLFTRYAEMPAVLYGPGDVRLAHAANERLPIDELVSATEVLTLMVARSIDA